MQRIVSGKKHRPYINVEMHVNIKMSRFVCQGIRKSRTNHTVAHFCQRGRVYHQRRVANCAFSESMKEKNIPLPNNLCLRNNKQECMYNHIIEYSCFNAIRTFLFMNISPSMQPFSKERAKIAPPPGQPWVPTWCHTSRSLVPGPVSNNPFFAGMASRFFFGGWKWKGHGSISGFTIQTSLSSKPSLKAILGFNYENQDLTKNHGT